MTLILAIKDKDNSKVWIAGDKAVSRGGIVCQKRHTKIKDYNNILVGGAGYSSDILLFKERLSHYEKTITKAEIVKAMKLKEEDNYTEIEYDILGVYKNNGNIFYGGYRTSAEDSKIKYFYEEIDKADAMLYPKCSGLDHETLWCIWEALVHIKDIPKKIQKVFKVVSKIYSGTISQEFTLHEIAIPQN